MDSYAQELLTPLLLSVFNFPTDREAADRIQVTWLGQQHSNYQILLSSTEVPPNAVCELHSKCYP